MKQKMYSAIEKHMLSCMTDGAHDGFHVYRVLYAALDIAKAYSIDSDVLIAACLLHDIGRNAQFKDPECDHAATGGDIAYDFLRGIGWDADKAGHVKECISSHRYRNSRPPETIEAKILYDADKLDVTGTLGIARTLAYKGIVSEPLYAVDETGNVTAGDSSEQPSFFREYNFKLANVYDKFFTGRAKEIADERKKASAGFYKNMVNEVSSIHQIGLQLLKNVIETEG